MANAQPGASKLSALGIGLNTLLRTYVAPRGAQGVIWAPSLAASQAQAWPRSQGSRLRGAITAQPAASGRAVRSRAASPGR
jgi:hypothetical protein